MALVRLSQPLAGPALGRDGDFPAAGKIEAGEGLGPGYQVLRRPGKDHLATVAAGPRPHVDDVVRGQDGVRVVFHHDDGVPQVPEHLEGGKQPLGVPGVQADGGLIQDVEDAAQFRADLGGQADALGLAAGQSGSGPLQGQVIQAHLQEEPQPFADFFDHPPGDFLLPGVSFRPANQS